MGKNPKVPLSEIPKEKRIQCPVDRARFHAKAVPLKITIGPDDKPTTVVADVKEFSTGSLGWSHVQKMTVIVDGIECRCQLCLNLTIIGSKEV